MATTNYAHTFTAKYRDGQVRPSVQSGTIILRDDVYASYYEVNPTGSAITTPVLESFIKWVRSVEDRDVTVSGVLFADGSAAVRIEHNS